MYVFSYKSSQAQMKLNNRQVKHRWSIVVLVAIILSCSIFVHIKRIKKSTNPLHNIKFSLPVGPPVDRKCTNCGCQFRIAGPIWNSRLHDYEFVEMLKKNLDVKLNDASDDEVGKKRFSTYRRLKGMLYMVGEELPDSPFFYSLNEFRRVLRLGTIPSADFKSAILNAGFQVSQSHTNPDSFKTNAPSALVWDIILAWFKLNLKEDENTQSETKNMANNKKNEKHVFK